MTAEEIRKHWNVIGSYPPELMGDFGMIEAAAQLAELNQTMTVIATMLENINDAIRSGCCR